MDVHNRKTQNLSDGQRDQVLGRYLSMRHKLGFQYFKEELNGLKKEKDDAALVMQDQKKKKIYGLEEITIMRM